jgi:hypothetical protein
MNHAFRRYSIQLPITMAGLYLTVSAPTLFLVPVYIFKSIARLTRF